MAELRIPIIGEFKGQKAFNQAGKATSTLEKGVKRLGGTLAATFGAQQLLKFAKNAAKAFIEDEKAVSQLAQSVKNLGLAFETPRIEAFISQLSKASGVTDDQLRPAMQKLLQTTGSVTKSQELLTQALDISRGSGVDYETVVEDLTKAYVGQTRGLNKYKLGLTQAELKTMSFADVQNKLTDQFSGANAAYLTTYAGKMQILSTAAGEAQETIGKGLVDSLALLAGDGNSIQPLADSMASFAGYISDSIYGVAVLIDKMKAIPGLDFVIRNQDTLRKYAGSPGLLFGALDYFNKLGQQARPTPTVTHGYLGSRPVGIYPTAEETAARKAAEAAAAKRAKELAALQAKALALQVKAAAEAKKKAALDKASKTLNLDAIGIEAALKGKISETDRISLNLQKAILEGNGTLAEKLAKDLEDAVKRNNELRLLLLSTPKAPNPYSEWKVPTLDFGGNKLGTVVPKFTPPSFVTADMFATDSGMGPNRYTPPAPVVNVEVKVAGEDVAAIITQTQTNQSLSGSFVGVNRLGRFGNVSVAE